MKSRPLPAGAVIFLIAIAALMLLPVLALVWLATGVGEGGWPHLLRFVLPAAALDTALLLTGVAVGTALIGCGAAWLVSTASFFGRRVLQWALVLPLAMPVYIAAFGWVEFLDFTGPVQSAVRALTGATSVRDYWFPDIRSLPGAVVVFSLVLYPYVYLPCRLVFMVQGASLLDAGRGLGAGPARLFQRVGLPMARPAIAAGVALALMEALNDIGAVEALGVRTLTYAVFETWLNRSDLTGAVQLALCVLIVVAFLVWLERVARRGRGYANPTRERPPSRIELSVGQQTAAFGACALPVLLGLGIPLWVFATYALRRLDQFWAGELPTTVGNSLLVASATAVVATVFAYSLLQLARLFRSTRIATAGRLLTLGYAVPGTVLALGLLVPLAAFDNWLDGLLRASFSVSSGLLLSGGIIVLVYAYTLRFLAIAYGTIETGFNRITPSVDMAGRALGRTDGRLAQSVHLPMLAPALLAGGLLVFVDSVKELSATLLLRPFGFQTLSTLIYERFSQGAVEDAAPAAVLIVLLGFVPIVVLHGHQVMKGQKKTGPKARGSEIG